MKIPIVVIIGRPNVGKSALFNRLVGKRDAIVDKVSGVTRDRNYGEVEWCGKIFNLIDTGGFVPDSENVFEQAIIEQIDAAVIECDSIIFLLDVNDGVTPVDQLIANQLRKSNKPVYVVANKTDSAGKENLVPAIYELGFDAVYNMSGLFGRNVGDFLDILTENFPLNTDLISETSSIPRYAVVGRPNVGKSSFVNSLLGFNRNIVTDIPGTTRDSLDSTLKYYGKEIILIDTAGLRKRSRIDENIEFYSVLRTLKSLDRCDIAIVLIDANWGIEKQDMRIINEAVKRKRGIVLCINKWDLIEKDDKTAQQFEKTLISQLGELNYIPVIFISALTKQRIYKVIDLSFQILDEWSKKISTSDLNDFIEKTFRNISLPSTTTGKEVKIKYGVQVKSSPPIFSFFVNDPKSIQENTKRFIVNKIRGEYGFAGVPLTVLFKQK
ncbi:MAG: ribosome biogenesis GTPase Der [Bacteroidetes bacterium]|nr:ribosome biogenesis GTPase Der [Bacteroidota bacterium]MBU2585069.1 ribosome biogenesis GTPase Der [Bacteroidota bacterium]